jgi:hypothetical protein
VQTALGLAIVDESVFALQRQDPGFAKLYFMLEAELLEPFYQDTSIQAAWSNAPTTGLAMQANSRPEKMENLRQTQRDGLLTLTTLTLLSLALMPLLLWLVVILALRGSGVASARWWGWPRSAGYCWLFWPPCTG